MSLPVDLQANKQLTSLHNELNLITWEGEDEGWNLAIAAVQSRILAILEQQKRDDMANSFSVATAGPQPVVDPQKAAEDDAKLYGIGAYRQRADGTAEHIPFDELIIKTSSRPPTREQLWDRLLETADAYIEKDDNPAIMIGLADGKTFLGLGTKGQFTLMCDGRSGAQMELDASLPSDALTGNSITSVPIGQQGTLDIERVVNNAMMGNSHPTDEGYLLFISKDEVDTVARQVKLAVAALPKPYKLKVWYGAMPESNGKSNFTAILYGDDIAEGITLDRSEYPDRVRYEADRASYLIGELSEMPDILGYNPDNHSGYVEPEDFGHKVTNMICDIRKAESMSLRDSLVEKLIELIDPSALAIVRPIIQPDHCVRCQGSGHISTGIEESPTEQCRKCEGTGFAPVK